MALRRISGLRHSSLAGAESWDLALPYASFPYLQPLTKTLSLSIKWKGGA